MSLLYGKDEHQPSARAFRIGLALVVLCGAALRLYRLGMDELWLDETISATAAMGGVGDILRGTLSPKSPPLYYLILHYWSAAFGIGEISLRSLSAIIGMCLVAGTGCVGARFFSRRAGLAAAALAAVAPLGVYYSQESRSYILLASAGLAYIGFSMALADGRTLGRQVGFVASGVLLSYTHAVGLFLLPFPNLIMSAGPLRKNYFRLLSLEAVIAVCAFPYWFWLAREVPLELAGWVEGLWLAMKPGEAFLRTFEALIAGADYPKLIFRLWQVHEPVLTSVSIVFFTSLLILGVCRPREKDVRVSVRNAPLWAGLAIVLPLVSCYLVSIFWQPVYLVGRTDFLIAPILYLLLGAGVARLKPILLACAVVAVVSLSGNDLIRYYYRLPMESYKRTAAYLAEETSEADRIILTGTTSITISYYLKKNGIRRKLISYPSGETMVKHSYDPELLRRDGAALQKQAEEAGKTLRRDSRNGEKIFVVTDRIRFDDVNGHLFSAMKSGYRLLERANDANGVPVYVFSAGR